MTNMICNAAHNMQCCMLDEAETESTSDSVRRVDYLSLDIEGPELEVLETIPWHRVDITVIAVETEFIGEFVEKKEKIRNLLEAQGTYSMYSIGIIMCSSYINKLSVHKAFLMGLGGKILKCCCNIFHFFTEGPAVYCTATI